MKHAETVLGVAVLALVLGGTVGAALWKSREETREQERALARAQELSRAAGHVIDFRGGAGAAPPAPAFEGGGAWTTSSPRRAWGLCTGAVEALLRAPATASFSEFTGESVRQISGSNRFAVAGWVDSENGFGALLRSDWTCVANLDAEVANVTALTAR